MAHELERWTDGPNGPRTASFVSARQHAWHRLGTVLSAEFDAAQAMQYAKLGGWQVRKEPLTTTVLSADGVSSLAVPNHFASVRTHPVTGQPDVLGVVGRGYTPIQNEDHAQLLDRLVDESGAHFETAGSLRGGRQVFLSMKLPRTLRIGGIDPIDLYLVACNSHDGTSAFRLLVSPIRVVCANTQAAAIRGAKASYSIRHTAGAQGQITQARAALGLTFAYAEAFQAQAERMIAASISTDEFARIVGDLWPVDEESKRSKTIGENRRYQLVELLRHSPTNEDIRGTRWAAYQAITEYADHVAPIADKWNPAAARAERAVTSSSITQVKTRAFDLLTA